MNRDIYVIIALDTNYRGEPDPYIVHGDASRVGACVVAQRYREEQDEDRRKAPPSWRVSHGPAIEYIVDSVGHVRSAGESILWSEGP